MIIPWAIPQVIAVLAWRGEFNFEYGYPDILLQSIGLDPIQWLTNPTWNFIAMLIVNIWLGIPFMMVILLGGLQSIAGDYYEAAEIDVDTDTYSAEEEDEGVFDPMVGTIDRAETVGGMGSSRKDAMDEAIEGNEE